MECGNIGKQTSQSIGTKKPRNQVHTSLWNTGKCSTGSRWLARCMWRVRQQLLPADLISAYETLELLACKIFRVNKGHTVRPLQLQTPCSTRCVASFLHLCQTHLLLQTAVTRPQQHTTLHKMGWRLHRMVLPLVPLLLKKPLSERVSIKVMLRYKIQSYRTSYSLGAPVQCQQRQQKLMSTMEWHK